MPTDTTIIVNEPLFYGNKDDNPPKDALNAETFIERVDELAEKNAWNDEVTAKNAMSFLRGNARLYFSDFMRSLLKPTPYRAVTTTYTAAAGFKPAFKKHFFTLGGVDDLTLQWTKFSQDRAETAQRYAIRCIAEMGRFTELIANQASDDILTTDSDLSADITALLTTQALRDSWTATRNAIAAEAQRAGKTAFKEVVVKKLISGGMTSTRMREFVEKEDRKGTSIFNIVTLIDQEEKRQNNNHTGNNQHRQANNQNRQKSNSNNKNTRAHAVNNYDDSESEDDAAADRANKNNAPTQNPTQTTSTTNPSKSKPAYRGRGGRGRYGRANETRHCTFCNMPGHTLKQCYYAPQEESNEHPSEQDAPPKDPQTSAISVDFSDFLTFSENY